MAFKRSGVQFSSAPPAGNAVLRQLAEEPDLVIELDPELADFMGAFEEKALDGETL